VCWQVMAAELPLHKPHFLPDGVESGR